MVTSKAMNTNAAAASAASSNVNNGTDSDTKFDPYALGVQFVRQYYTMLNEDPQNLFRFYGRESYMVHGNGTDRCDPIKGQDAIKKKILSLGYKDCRTKIDSVDSLESSLDNVVIQVVGQLSNNRQPMRRFFQTFVLCRRNTNHYFVKNDIFRFQEYDYPEEDDYFENELNNSQASAIETNQSENASINELNINSLTVSSNNDVHPNNLSATNITKNSINSSSNNTNSANNINLDEVNQLNSSNTSNMISSTILSGSTNGNASLEPLQATEPTQTVIEQLTSSLATQNDISVATVNSLKTSQDLFYNHEPVEEKTSIESSNIFNQNLIDSKAEAIRNTVSTYANMVLRSSKNQTSNYPISESIQINKTKQTNASSNLTNATNNTNNNNNATNDFHNAGDTFGTFSKESHGSFNKNESKNNGGGAFFDTFNSNDNGFGSHFTTHKKESNSHSDSQQIFIGHLDQSISEEQLNSFFSQYGPVLEVNINRSNQRQGKALNFGFVIFEQSESVQKVLASKPIIINGQRINVEEKRAPNGRGNGSNGFGRFNANNRSSYTNGNGHSGQFNSFSSRNHQRDGPRNERNNDRSDRNGLKRKPFNPTPNANRINSNAFNRQ